MTRDGRDIKFRNFEAVDGSTDEVVSLMLWEDEWIEKAGLWEPKRTVLLLVDVRITYDNFKKKTVLSTGCFKKLNLKKKFSYNFVINFFLTSFINF